MTARLRTLLVAGCLLVATLYVPDNLALLRATEGAVPLSASFAGAPALHDPLSKQCVGSSPLLVGFLPSPAAESAGSASRRSGPALAHPTETVTAVARELAAARRPRPAAVLAGWRRAEEIHVATRPAPPEEELAGE